MKSKTITLLLLLVTAISTNAATISQWTFEVNTPADLNNSTTSPSVAADVGSGTASGLHASAVTDWSTPAGNGSANSLSANTWAVGDYWQFEVDTRGFENISVGWDQLSSSTGPRDFGLFYSTDGTVFTQFMANYTVGISYASYSRDLSSIVTLNDDPSVYFRLRDMTTISAGNATVANAGTDRIDNFVVSGTVKASVPDSSPGWFGLGCVVAFLAFASRRQELTTLVR